MNAIRNFIAILTAVLATIRYDLVEYYGRAKIVGGYVHDTSMTQWIPPTMAFGDTATWALGAGEVTNSIVLACDATDETANLYIPIPVPSNSVDGKGAYLKSIEVDYEIKTAACDTVTATLYRMDRGADDADVTVTSVAFSYDAAHDTDDERDDLQEHKMTLTLTTPAWVDNDDYYWLVIAFDKAATSIVQFLGAFANYTLRL